ncbi:MAG: hypothetical protein NVS9B12_09720 [Vulcanimicrobiaceae bacterium]
MASPENLARFVARTLDEAQKNGAAQTWIELSDHGAGDGGGLQADSTGEIMSIAGMASAIASGIAQHAQAHPEDANRTIDGVVANQCLMASLGFADELSRAGVKYLAASPETMISPGTPTSVAHAIAQHVDDPAAMAKAVVRTVMDYRYRAVGETWGPAACFDVLDLSQPKWNAIENRVKAFNDAVAAQARAALTAIREDTRSVEGMARFPEATPDMPWHADRPALALYDTIARDGRLDPALRTLARNSENAIRATVLAHSEASGFDPFGGAGYSDAAGPTVHAPADAAQVDPWAPNISETRNDFYKKADQGKFSAAMG